MSAHAKPLGPPDELLAELPQVPGVAAEGGVRQGRDEGNDWAYDYLPKLDKLYDMLRSSTMMAQGKLNGYLPGLQPARLRPDKEKITTGLRS